MILFLSYKGSDQGASSVTTLITSIFNLIFEYLSNYFRLALCKYSLTAVLLPFTLTLKSVVPISAIDQTESSTNKSHAGNANY